MTRKLILMGASLMDVENTSKLGSLLDQNPFEDEIYNEGGNRKASDGLVLGEHIAVALGANVTDIQSFDILFDASPTKANIHNYAHAGAESGNGPSQTIPLYGTLSIGLREQIKLMKKNKSHYKKIGDVDVIISCGENDLLNALDLTDEITSAIQTKTKKDDKKLSAAIAKPIAKNLKKSIDKITGFVDEIIVAGTFPITETPYAKEWAMLFPEGMRDNAVQIIDNASVKLQKKLKKYFKKEDNIICIDGIKIWNQLEATSFVDSIHPDAMTTQKLAEHIVSEASQSLDSLGFQL